MGIGPGGLEPPFPDPKSGVLPLDEGPAVLGLQLRHITLRGQRLGGASRNSPCNGHVRASLERRPFRSEEHTSELQSQSNLVCRLLLEKKNTSKTNQPRHTTESHHPHVCPLYDANRNIH